MVKKINSANIHTEHVKVTVATKEKLRRQAYKFKLPECHLADLVLSKYLDLFNPNKPDNLIRNHSAGKPVAADTKFLKRYLKLKGRGILSHKK